MKTRRQAALCELVEAGSIGSHADAVGQLADLGWEVTQATVSRDLDDLGAVRIRDGERIRYALVQSNSAYGASLATVLRSFVVSREMSGPLVVLRTPPGHASMVAAAIDRAHIDGIVGTIAGDDTLFVCGDDATQGAGVMEVLDRMEAER